MRRAFSNKSIIEENGVFYGISLGYDYCAEHEWGIKRIVSKFGIDHSKMGVAGRTISKGFVYFAEDKKTCVLTSRKPYNIEGEVFTPEQLLSHDLKNMYDDLETAWAEDDFCVATKNPEQFKNFKELYDAFLGNDIAISFITSEHPAFENASLSLVIVSKLPQEVKDGMLYVDKKHFDLIEYEKEIGVTELKEKTRNGYENEKYFMACSPKWIEYDDEVRREEIKKNLGTKYNIRFWVNYSDDDDNYGWYTAEKIIQWLSTPGLKLKSLNDVKS